MEIVAVVALLFLLVGAFASMVKIRFWARGPTLWEAEQEQMEECFTEDRCLRRGPVMGLRRASEYNLGMTTISHMSGTSLAAGGLAA
jgi:hypothetical protein